MGTPELMALSINKCTEVSSLSRSALYKAMHEKRLVYKKYGKRTFILANDLQEFINREFK